MKFIEKLADWLDKLALGTVLTMATVIGLFPVYFFVGGLLLAGHMAVYGVSRCQRPEATPALTAAEVSRECHGCRCRTECWRNGECRTVCRDSCGQFCFQ